MELRRFFLRQHWPELRTRDQGRFCEVQKHIKQIISKGRYVTEVWEVLSLDCVINEVRSRNSWNSSSVESFL